MDDAIVPLGKVAQQFEFAVREAYRLIPQVARCVRKSISSRPTATRWTVGCARRSTARMCASSSSRSIGFVM